MQLYRFNTRNLESMNSMFRGKGGFPGSARFDVFEPDSPPYAIHNKIINNKRNKIREYFELCVLIPRTMRNALCTDLRQTYKTGVY